MADKVALVTGAGTGIGKAAALALSGAGYAVVLAGRRRDPLEATAEEAGSEAETLVAPADVSDPASVRNLFEEIEATFGRLDLLFNNAGVSAPAVPLDELDFEAWRKVIDINVSGAFLCTQAAFKLMKRQSPRGGRIINNGSVSAHAPRPNSAPYTASKHAMTGLTKATSLDGRAFDIACSQIDIGNAHTDMTEPMTEGIPQADGSVKTEPVMDTEHVAEAILYMSGLPLSANVLFMTVMATKMPFVGRG